ncbi:MAG: NAD(P)-dependent oxidoreductase [Chloroflexi bacterium]|nr:NAD(P)-dependent oxidoreductase [Chloroflexota bacterium]
MSNLGYIGLGTMGGRVAKRLLAAGHSIIGYDLIKSKADWLLEAGMKWGDSPREVAEKADVTFSMVTNTNAVLALTGGPDGVLAGLTPGKIYVDMSTISPAVSRDIAKQVAAKDAFMLDSPVSGSVETLEAGKLTLMVGGDEAIFEKVKPILLDIGPKATYVGANGLAVTMKIATNLSLGAQMLAFCEALLLAEKSGIKREVAAEVLLNSVIASPMLKYRGPFVLKMPDEAWFNVNMMQKDLNLALELGRQVNVPLPTTAVTNEILTAARGMGYVEEDYAVIFKVLAQMSGLEE